MTKPEIPSRLEYKLNIHIEMALPIKIKPAAEGGGAVLPDSAKDSVEAGLSELMDWAKKYSFLLSKFDAGQQG